MRKTWWMLGNIRLAVVDDWSKKKKKFLVELDLHNYVITYNCIVVNYFLLGVNF